MNVWEFTTLPYSLLSEHLFMSDQVPWDFFSIKYYWYTSVRLLEKFVTNYRKQSPNPWQIILLKTTWHIDCGCLWQSNKHHDQSLDIDDNDDTQVFQTWLYWRKVTLGLIAQMGCDITLIIKDYWSTLQQFYIHHFPTTQNLMEMSVRDPHCHLTPRGSSIPSS
jgi:hypothetical protein